MTDLAGFVLNSICGDLGGKVGALGRWERGWRTWMLLRSVTLI